MFEIDVFQFILNPYIGPLIFLASLLIGFWFFKKARQFKVDLLRYAGYFVIVGNLHLVGTYISLFLGFSEVGLVYSSIIGGYMWWPISLYFGLHIGVEFVIPHIQKYFFLVLKILVLSFEIFIFIYPLFFLEDIIMNSLLFFPNLYGLVKILNYNFLIIYLGVNGIGLLFKSIRSKGYLRRKFLMLSTAFLVDILNFLEPWNILIIIIQAPLIFYSLRPKKEKKPKKPKEKKGPSKKAIDLASFILGKPDLASEIETLQKRIEKIEKELTIFISYATKDTNMYNVREIANQLSTYNEIKKVLFWQEDMEDNIIKYMNDNLGKCDAMVLFCSKNALNSEPVEKEWTAAEIMGKPIIPVFYKTKYIPPLLKTRLGLEYDLYDIKKNVQNLYELIVKKYTSFQKEI